MRFSMAGQYFHRIASYNEDIISADFPRLVNQDWNVDDFNIRMTFRPKLPACMGSLSTGHALRFRAYLDRQPVVSLTAKPLPSCKVVKSKSM